MPTKFRSNTKNKFVDCNRTMKKVHYIRRATDAAAFTTAAVTVHFFFLSFLTDRKREATEIERKKNHRTKNKNEIQLPTNCFALYEVQ